jgi:hypothetical protein
MVKLLNFTDSELLVIVKKGGIGFNLLYLKQERESLNIFPV